MKPSKHNRTKMNRVLRDMLLEASELELREALHGGPGDFDALAARGRAAAQRALASTEDTADVQDLHRGLGALLQMLRRRDRVSVDQLAAQARVDADELRRIEVDAPFEPNPRTIYQLEQYFKLPARSLVILSGAVRVDSDVRAEAVRFAASSKNMAELNRDERKLLNRFVKFLRGHTDR
jgi:HTH-type transcriptional regulator, competence development regulator